MQRTLKARTLSLRRLRLLDLSFSPPLIDETRWRRTSGGEFLRKAVQFSSGLVSRHAKIYHPRPRYKRLTRLSCLRAIGYHHHRGVMSGVDVMSGITSMEKFPVSFDEIESVCLPIRIWKEEEEEGVLWRACEGKFEISFFRGEKDKGRDWIWVWIFFLTRIRFRVYCTMI